MASEKRLIDANALGIGRCNPDLLPFCNRPYAAGWNGVVNLIENAPTVDAEEVVHGEWISWEKADNFIPSPDRHECSVCHDAAQVLVNGFELLSPYCPNCGAKMDGDGNDS